MFEDFSLFLSHTKWLTFYYYHLNKPISHLLQLKHPIFHWIDDSDKGFCLISYVRLCVMEEKTMDNAFFAVLMSVNDFINSGHLAF